MNEQAREAFRGYVAARSTALLRTAYMLTGNRADAEDLLQTGLAKTYLAWESIRDRHSIDAYVRRVMVNTRTSWWRRRKHFKEIVTDDVLETPVTRDATDDVVLHDALWTALSSLPTRQRTAVVLRYYEDLSEAETAQLLGVSVGTVKSTTARALAKMREHPGLRDSPDSTPPPHGPADSDGSASTNSDGSASTNSDGSASTDSDGSASTDSDGSASRGATFYGVTL